ncbi:MAG: glycoside hydrolase family 127 protein [Phycisphaerales bacterium]|nr:glycoside hydrolase family 127 protein [Phycisphaerales bacterium]
MANSLRLRPALAPMLAIALFAPSLPAAGDGGATAVPLTQVRVHDEFWAPRIARDRAVTLGHVLDECEETGRIANFEVAAGAKSGGMNGYFFNDSDVYKAIEGAAYLLATQPDPAVEARCDAIIEKIAAAQMPDGYLYTPREIMDPKNPPPGGPERWSDVGSGHELYCAGHLYEAGIAYFEATGKRRLLDVAIKNADLVCSAFGPGKDPHPPGHPEIELALARLYRLTGEQRYLDAMGFFIETRGQAGRGRDLYGEYAQDSRPVLEQSEAEGHAVRLAYLYSGVTDLATLTGRTEYLGASERVWDDIVRTKLYITGGVGSQGNNEGFGRAYDLPNSSAYNETCSSIALILWSRRLALATGDAKYSDVMERTLYNAMLAGWSESGDRFFYPNPLESARGAERSPWFACACCPPNVLRFIASMPGMIYSTADRGLTVDLYVGSDAGVVVGGTPVRVSQETRYPSDGRVELKIEPERATRFALRLRVPGWARGEVTPGGLYRFIDAGGEGPTLLINGEATALTLDRGYAVLDREWKPGDKVELDLPMPVRRVVADDRVATDRGRMALQRGPLVYCFEAADAMGQSVLSYVADPSQPWMVQQVAAPPQIVCSVKTASRDSAGHARADGIAVATGIPYSSWANRDRGAMEVWLATDAAYAKPTPSPSLAHRARASSSFGGDLAALSDQMEPKSSDDHDNPFLHWWPRKGTEEWVQYDLAEPTRVGGVEVYWFDDTGRGECRLPASWKLLANVDGQWREVSDPSGYGVDGDRYNRCTFDPVVAAGLRIVVQSQEGWAGGIHEWRVLSPDDLIAQSQPGEAEGASGPNLLPNASFEDVEGDAPLHWRRSVWGGEPSAMVALDSGQDGDGAVAISSETGADAGWSCTVPVEMNSRYRLSGWIATLDVVAKGNAHGALLNIHNLQEVRTRALTGTNDWTYVSVEFDTGPNDSVMINCLFGGWGLATGIANYDNIRLELLEKGEAPAPRISIDAARTGPDQQVHLRAVHRAPGPVHLRRDLVGDARGPEVLYARG